MFAGLLLPMFVRMIENREISGRCLIWVLKWCSCFAHGQHYLFVFPPADHGIAVYQRQQLFGHYIRVYDQFLSPSAPLIFSAAWSLRTAVSENSIYYRSRAFCQPGPQCLIPGIKGAGSSIATDITQIVILGAHIYIAESYFPALRIQKKWMPVFLFLPCIIGSPTSAYNFTDPMVYAIRPSRFGCRWPQLFCWHHPLPATWEPFSATVWAVYAKGLN